MATLKRRWLQFSLRTGLITVTLLCIALTIWVVPAERQQRAVESIEAFGGTVGKRWGISVTGFGRRPRFFDGVHYANLMNCNVSDAQLECLQHLADLEMLDLSGTRLTDAGLVNLIGLQKLQELNLGDTGITDAGLVHLRHLSALKLLFVDLTGVTQEGLWRLHEALPHCTIYGPKNLIKPRVPSDQRKSLFMRPRS